MSNNILNYCLNILKTPEVQNEIVTFMKPVINCIINEFYPNIYISIFLVFICFFLILAIFLLLIKNK